MSVKIPFGNSRVCVEGLLRAKRFLEDNGHEVPDDLQEALDKFPAWALWRIDDGNAHRIPGGEVWLVQSEAEKVAERHQAFVRRIQDKARKDPAWVKKMPKLTTVEARRVR